MQNHHHQYSKFLSDVIQKVDQGLVVGVENHKGREVLDDCWGHEVNGRPVWKCGDEVSWIGLFLVEGMGVRVHCVDEVPPQKM